MNGIACAACAKTVIFLSVEIHFLCSDKRLLLLLACNSFYTDKLFSPNKFYGSRRVQQL